MSTSKIATLITVSKEYLMTVPEGPKARIYVLERHDRDDAVPVQRPGSFSWSRGDGPGSFERNAIEPPAMDPNKFYGLAEILAMKKRASAPRRDEAHVLTLDLEEIPELAEMFPGARAVTLFAPLSDDPDSWSEARLLAVPPTAAAPMNGHPVTVIPIDVPAAIFADVDNGDASDEDDPLAKIRSLVMNCPGYVLGAPIYLQEQFDTTDDRFVMQLRSSIADINLGDSGALYVFESSTFMQSL